jgi:hypothetical protein
LKERFERTTAVEKTNIKRQKDLCAGCQQAIATLDFQSTEQYDHQLRQQQLRESTLHL